MKSTFDSDAPLRLEIGCGKGKFILETAQNNPDINFLAFEKCLDDRFEEVIYGNINDYTDTLIYVYSLEGKEGNDRKDIFIEKEFVEEINILTDAADNRGMKKVLDGCRNLSYAASEVTILSAMNEKNIAQVEAMAEELSGVAANEFACSVEKRYICRTCGYEYVGESLPEDFACPICKRGTEEFEEIS